jgi:NAD(P)-dependent dehydrogenase (short-subunit alcohol dehydrogenase family)
MLRMGSGGECAKLAWTRRLWNFADCQSRSNAVCPGFLQTTMTQNLQGDPAARKEIDRAHPLGGMGVVEDVARSVVYLASGDAAWVTGVNLPVDGGYTTM